MPQKDMGSKNLLLKEGSFTVTCAKYEPGGKINFILGFLMIAKKISNLFAVLETYFCFWSYTFASPNLPKVIANFSWLPFIKDI